MLLAAHKAAPRAGSTQAAERRQPCRGLAARPRRRRAGAAVAAASPEQRHVCVVGGGVAGLTTALRLLEEVPGACVTVYAEQWGTDLTSAGAAGLWEPYKLSDTPESRVHAWGAATYDHLLRLVHSPEAAAAGVSTVYATSLFRAPEGDPFWADITPGFERLRPGHAELFTQSVQWDAPVILEAGGALAAEANLPDAWVDGYNFHTLICEGRLYMRWLSARILELGGQLEQRGLSGLAELAEEGFDALVLCCGLGAKELLGDDECYPIRGQIARVRAPWVRQCYFGHWGDETTYVIPNREWVVVGGTGQVGDWRTSTDLGDAEAIMGRACQLLPSLASAELLDHWVGLRPGRTQLRLELEWAKLGPGATSSTDGEGGGGGGGDNGSGGSGGGGGAGGRGATPVVYNYGHGGAGLTLAWGTAGEAVELVRGALEARGGGA